MDRQSAAGRYLAASQPPKFKTSRPENGLVIGKPPKAAVRL
jgi:hypothetical protein